MTKTSILSNGLKVITSAMPNAETVAINIWVNAGARDETLAQNGLSHFLEHMAFKGTHTRSALQIAETFDNIGGHLNASTSREHTVYYAKVLREHTPIAIDVLTDILQHSTFDLQELDRERGVILQELAMTLDTPDDIIFDYFQETAYANQALGQPILGTVENIEGFKPDDFKNFIEQFYSIDKMVVSVAGQMDHAHVVDLLEKHTQDLKKQTIPPRTKAHYTGGVHLKDKDLEQVHFILGFQGLPYQSVDELYKQQLLSVILSGGMSSRLFQEIREKRGLAYSVYSSTSSYQDTGIFSIYTSTNPKDIKQCIDVTADVIQSASHTISEDELQRAKTQICAALRMGYERAGFQADEMGRNISCIGRHIPKEEILKKYQAITVNEVQDILVKTLKQSRPTITALGNIKHIPDYNIVWEQFKI